MWGESRVARQCPCALGRRGAGSRPWAGGGGKVGEGEDLEQRRALRGPQRLGRTDAGGAARSEHTRCPISKVCSLSPVMCIKFPSFPPPFRGHVLRVALPVRRKARARGKGGEIDPSAGEMGRVLKGGRGFAASRGTSYLLLLRSTAASDARPHGAEIRRATTTTPLPLYPSL
uniref:Uncharacterized protein n=1 Tax=Timema shepardi TaxID=629360 RepID=A0A7R9ATS0_TIMSH|nr:unnamed protein product [Timema shepardi]